MAVVQIINALKMNDLFLGMCIRNLLWIAARTKIYVVARHIPGHHNVVADASRLIQDLTGNAQIVTTSGVNLQWLERESLLLNRNL